MELLKSQFCISNVLLHLLFCERSPSAPGNCKQCSQSYVYDDYDVYARRFVSYVRHHCTSVLPSNNVFDKDLEPLFARPEVEVSIIDLNLLYLSKDYYDLVVSKQNRCMYFLVARHPCELAIVLSKVLVRILLNEIISIADDILKSHVSGYVFGISIRKEKRGLFLMAGAEFVRKFYFRVCRFLRADSFVGTDRDFVPNVHYSANMLKTVNLHYINYSGYTIKKQ